VQGPARENQDGGQHDQQQSHGGPAPGFALAQAQQQGDQSGAEQDRADAVERPPCQVAAAGQHDDGQQQRKAADGRPEPERSVEAPAVGEKPGQRVAEPDPGRGGDRQDGHRAARPVCRQVISGQCHRQGHQAETDALHTATDQEPAVAQRQRGQHAAQHDQTQRAEHDAATIRTVAQPAEDRRGHRAHQQSDGQRPLRPADADVVVDGHGRDQRSAQAADHSYHHSHEHQHGDEGAVAPADVWPSEAGGCGWGGDRHGHKESSVVLVCLQLMSPDDDIDR